MRLRSILLNTYAEKSILENPARNRQAPFSAKLSLQTKARAKFDTRGSIQNLSTVTSGFPHNNRLTNGSQPTGKCRTLPKTAPPLTTGSSTFEGSPDTTVGRRTTLHSPTQGNPMQPNATQSTPYADHAGSVYAANPARSAIK
jgi:hypothetical protein